MPITDTGIFGTATRSKINRVYGFNPIKGMIIVTARNVIFNP